MTTTSPQRETAAARRYYALNVPLLVGTLVLFVVGLPAAHAWRTHQVNRTAHAFLDRADQCEEDATWAQAAGYLHRYLRLRPDDDDARVRLAETFARAADSPRSRFRAIELYYQALGAAPEEDQPRLLKALSTLLLSVARFAEAEKTAHDLCAAAPDDPAAARLLALALHGQARSGALTGRDGKMAIGEEIERAVALNPADAELAEILARLFRGDPGKSTPAAFILDWNLWIGPAPLYGDQWLAASQRAVSAAERKTRADALLDQAVDAQPHDPRALMLRYWYRKDYGLSGADEDLNRALQCATDHVPALWAAADEASRLAARNGCDEYYDLACCCLERIIALTRKSETAYVSLGRLHVEAGQAETALTVWREGLRQAGRDSTTLHQYIADVLLSTGKVDEALEHVTALEQAAQRLPAGVALASRVRIENAAAFYRARWLVAKGRPTEAVPQLKRIAANKGGVGEASLAHKSLLLLAQLHLASRDWDQAAALFDQAADLRSNLAALRVADLAALRVAAATAWAQAGRADLAVRDFEKAIEIEDRPAVRLALALAQLQRQKQLPAGERNWAGFKAAVEQARRAAGAALSAEMWRIDHADIESEAIRAIDEDSRAEGFAEAAEMLRQLESKYPATPELLLSQARLYYQCKCEDDFARTVETLGRLPGHATTAHLLRADRWLREKQPQRAREELNQALTKAEGADRLRCQLGLAQVAIEDKQPDQAIAILATMCQDDPKNIALHRQIVEVCLEADQLREAEKWEQKLQAAEGEAGVSWRYYRARRLVAESRSAPAKLKEADELRTHVQNQRPLWPSVHLLAATIYERRGALDQAIDAYRDAIRLGERRLTAYERLVSLLLARQRFTEADELMVHLRDQAAASATLSPLEISAAGLAGRLDRAIEAARRGVEKRPDDAHAHLWLGKVLLENGKKDEAEKELLRAVELAPQDAQSYDGLFRFYVKTEQIDRARAALQDVAGKARLSEASRAFVLAQGHEIIGDTEQAQAAFKEAARLAPKNVAVLSRQAAFLWRHDPSEAEAVLRNILSLDPQASAARHSLAALLAARGGEQRWQEVEELLKQAETSGDNSAQKLRLHAMLLAQRGGKENRQKARQLIEELVNRGKGTLPSDRLLLAKLYEAEGKDVAAREQLATLVGRDDPDPMQYPTHLATYVDFLLRRGQADQALPWLEKLELRAPYDLQVVTLRARWLGAKDRADEIEPIVESRANDLLKGLTQRDAEKRRKAETQICVAVAGVLASVSRQEAAERWCRKAAALTPEAFEPLARTLQRQDRVAEAVDVCLQAATDEKTPQAAIVLCSVLQSGKPPAAELERAEPVIAKALATHKESIALLSSVAALRVVQQRLAEAATLYREVVRLKPNDPLALNNLATVLSEIPQHRAEAKRCIEQAIQLAGPHPNLLDTQATILLLSGQADEAASLLTTATAAPGADPRFYLHLAVAYERLGNQEKAREAFALAKAESLSRHILTPVDRQLFDELSQKLSGDKPD